MYHIINDKISQGKEGGNNFFGNVSTDILDNMDSLKCIPYVGAVVGAVDFISGLFGKSSRPVPMCFGRSSDQCSHFQFRNITMAILF
jgi:hypothetical protein